MPWCCKRHASCDKSVLLSRNVKLYFRSSKSSAKPALILALGDVWFDKDTTILYFQFAKRDILLLEISKPSHLSWFSPIKFCGYFFISKFKNCFSIHQRAVFFSPNRASEYAYLKGTWMFPYKSNWEKKKEEINYSHSSLYQQRTCGVLEFKSSPFVGEFAVYFSLLFHISFPFQSTASSAGFGKPFKKVSKFVRVFWYRQHSTKRLPVDWYGESERVKKS